MIFSVFSPFWLSRRAIDCLERLISEMIDLLYVSSGTLNFTTIISLSFLSPMISYRFYSHSYGIHFSHETAVIPGRRITSQCKESWRSITSTV